MKVIDIVPVIKSRVSFDLLGIDVSTFRGMKVVPLEDVIAFLKGNTKYGDTGQDAISIKINLNEMIRHLRKERP